MPRPFDPETDVGLLRDIIIDVLVGREGVTRAALVRGVTAYLAKLKDADGKPLRRPMPPSSLKDYLKSSKFTLRNMDYLRGIWEYLAAHRDYSRYLPEAKPKPSLTTTYIPSLEAGLSEAVVRFIQHEKPTTNLQFSELCDKYPGRYVMYRADLRPYKFKTDTETSPRFRASRLEIEPSDNCLVVTEVQDFPKTDRDNSFYMKTTGVLFPYGKHIMFLARAVARESFRLGVIDREYSFSNDYKVNFFRGMILVASSEDLFPSTPFFCLRDDGTLETGLIPYERITHNDARTHLRHAHDIAAFVYKKRFP